MLLTFNRFIRQFIKINCPLVNCPFTLSYITNTNSLIIYYLPNIILIPKSCPISKTLQSSTKNNNSVDLMALLTFSLQTLILILVVIQKLDKANSIPILHKFLIELILVQVTLISLKKINFGLNRKSISNVMESHIEWFKRKLIDFD